MLKRILIAIICVLPFTALAQLPAVKDTTLILPSNPYTGQWRYSTFGGDIIPQQYIGTKWFFMPTNKYLSKYFTTGAKTQAKLDSIYARVVNLYDNQTIGGSKTITGNWTFNNYLTANGVYIPVGSIFGDHFTLYDYSNGGIAGDFNYVSNSDPTAPAGTYVFGFDANNNYLVFRTRIGYRRILTTADLTGRPDSTSIANKYVAKMPSGFGANVTGTVGNGFVDLTSQSVSPVSATGHLRLYADSLNRLSWKNSNYRRTIRVPRLADMTITTPNKLNPILADSTDVDNSISSKQSTAINIYNKSSWANLNDFNITGTGFTLNPDSSITVSGGSGFTNYLSFKGLTNNDQNLEYSITGTINSLGGGIFFGKKTLQLGSPSNLYVGYNTAANTFSTGGVAIPSYQTVSVGDVFQINFSQRYDGYTGTFTNLSTGAVISNFASKTATTVSDFVIINNGTSFTIKNISIKSLTEPNPNVFATSDSKGSLAIPQLGAFNLLKGLGTVNQFSATGSTTGDILLTMPYNIKYFTPKNVLLFIGRNDVATGIPIDTIRAHYVSIRNQWIAKGATVVDMLPAPEPVADQTALTAMINSVSNRTINLSNGWNNSLYLASDSIHPNEAGERFIANRIITSPYFTQNKYSSNDNSLINNNTYVNINSANTWPQPQVFNQPITVTTKTLTLNGNVTIGNTFTTVAPITLTGTGTTNVTLPVGNSTLYGTRSASFSSAQLFTSLSDKTGTGGVNVFSTGPTITSPTFNNVKPASTFQTPTGTAGTDSLGVKIAATGKLGAISANYYATATALTAYTPTTRTITTTSPLTGGGDLSANRIFGLAGLTGLGTANQIVGMNAAATGYEYKTIVSGPGISITNAANSVTIASSSVRTSVNVTSNMTMALNTDYQNISTTQYVMTLPPCTSFATQGSLLITVLATGTGGAKISVPSGYALQTPAGATLTDGTGYVTIAQYQKIQLIPSSTTANTYYCQPLNGTITVH